MIHYPFNSGRYTLKWLLHILRELVILGLVFLVISQALNEFRKPKPKQRILPLEELLLTPKVHLSEVEGRDRAKDQTQTVLYFWGSWCSVCQLTSPMVSQVANEVDDLRVITIAISSGTDQEIVKYLREQRLDMTVINDKSSYWRSLYDVHLYPSFFIFDQAGELQFIETGFLTKVGLRARLWWSKM